MADIALSLADIGVGVMLLGCGVVTGLRQRRVGLIMAAAGVAWFLGDFAPALVFLHRGPLVHLHISYPTGRLRRPLAVVTVVAAYLAAAFDAIARNPWFTAGLAILVAAAAGDVFARTSGPARKAAVACPGRGLWFCRRPRSERRQQPARTRCRPDRAGRAYDAVVGLVVLWLTLDLRYGRWTEATIADLVMQLGRPTDAGGLQGELRKRLGDPSLVLGYGVPGRVDYVDESEAPVDTSGPNRVCTPILEDGEPVAVLVHDPATLDDPDLVIGAVSALRLAVANARMRAEAHRRRGRRHADRPVTLVSRAARR